MKKLQIKIVNNDISSNDVKDFLKHLNEKKSKDIELLFFNGTNIKVISNISAQAIYNELEKKFESEFEVREIE